METTTPTAPIKAHPGLNSAEARTRLQQYGLNILPEKAPDTLWQRFLRQFQSPLMYLLLNAGLGVYQESKSETALQRLKAMAAFLVRVLREGKLIHLPGAELVPGDVARIESGGHSGRWQLRRSARNHAG